MPEIDHQLSKFKNEGGNRGQEPGTVRGGGRQADVHLVLPEIIQAFVPLFQQFSIFSEFQG